MREIVKRLLLIPCLCACVMASDTRPQVTFELLTKPGPPVTASQQWYKVLSTLGISGLQIHAAGPRDETGISQVGSKSVPQYRVVGILGTDNVLYLPGGKFALSDTAKLRKWLNNLSDLGAEGVTGPRSAFGLIARQIEEVNDDLKRPVTFSTLEMPAGKAVAQVAGKLKYALELDETSRSELAGVIVADEMKDLSSGTVLAAILRPAGLALWPERPSGGEMQYRVGKSQAGREVWPVGWKPKGKPNLVLGDLFEFLNVEIKDTPVSEAVAAIQGRLKVPFLYDHNAMVLHGIDPSEVAADVPGKRMTYSLVLGKVLQQARLKYELRVDEAERPFVWITTVKPAS